MNNATVIVISVLAAVAIVAGANRIAIGRKVLGS
jgi:hypothetical protein